MTTPHALVAGATGLIGRRVVELLLTEGGWRVTGLSRSPPDASAATALAVDLTDAADCRRKLAELSSVTHLFYCARYDHPEGQVESEDINGAMLRNLLDALEPVAHGLRHVNVVHGTKHYGHHLGPVQVPLTEESPRGAGATYYFVQEDLLRSRASRAQWRYSIARPHAFLDADWTEPRNLALLIAAYAAVARERGVALAYPGTEKSFRVRTQFTAVPLLARAVVWMATAPPCANQAYNIVNGDTPAWAELWPRIAAYFDMPAAGPRPVDLGATANEQPVWESVVRRHGLRATRLSDLVSWPYGNYVFRPEWDIISGMSKARRDGFTQSADSAATLFSIFDALRAQRIVP